MTSWWPVVTGAILGAGLILVVTASPAWRRPSLADRVAPHVGSGVTTRRRTRSTSARPASVGIRQLARRLDGLLAGSAGVQRRLDQLGTGVSIEQLRVEQVTWAFTAAVGAVLILVVRASIAGSPGVVPAAFLVAAAAAAGVAGRDRWLSHQVSRRQTRMREELPTVAELLALAVSAGEGMTAALQRVSRVAHGELPGELRRVVDEMRSGHGLVESLEAMAGRVDLPELSRFVDGVVVAVDRGTPLGAVLQAQAADVREAQRRELIELGGRRDIYMMVPVVFLVLPLSVLFALFPGFYGIALSAP